MLSEEGLGAGGAPAAAARREPRGIFAGAVVFLVAAVCAIVFGRYRLWAHSLGALFGVAAVALGIVGAVTARKGRRSLPVVLAVLGGVAVVAAASFAVYATWLQATGALPPATPGVGTPFVVSTSKSGMWWPKVSGGTVVWMDDRNAPPTKTWENRDIYSRDLRHPSALPICTAPRSQLFPAISGETVVWTDKRNMPKARLLAPHQNSDIYGYDLSTQREFPICTAKGAQDHPDVAGGIVVWSDARRGPRNADVYGYDLSTQREFPICAAAGQQLSPAVSGHVVVWVDYRHHPYTTAGYDTAPCEIYGYDLDARRGFRVGAAIDGVRPLIDGQTVVWGSPNGDGGQTSFNVFDLGTRKQRTVAITGESFMGPAGLSGGRVVLIDDSGPLLAQGSAQVWLYDLLRGRSYPITTWGWASFADISGDLVTWYDGTDEGGSIKAVRVRE